MTPEDFLRRADHQLKAMKEIKKKHVAVGVLANEATGRIYENGVNVLQVAAIHEYGLGSSPQRSFLKMPQELKKKEISLFISKQLSKVFEGMQVERGLGLIGVYNVNLSVDAFATGGFGKWAELSQSTINDKGSSAILTDTGILKNSIAWEIR